MYQLLADRQQSSELLEYGVQWSGQRSIVFVTTLHEKSARYMTYRCVERKARIAKMCRLCKFIVAFFGQLSLKCATSMEPGFLVCSYSFVDFSFSSGVLTTHDAGWVGITVMYFSIAGRYFL